jgi:HK97 family phage prohead protease
LRLRAYLGDEVEIGRRKIEAFAPYAFSDWLANAGRAIHLRFDHHDFSARRFARVSDGTLRVWEDDVGLAFAAKVEPGRSAWQFLTSVVASKEVCRASFSFAPLRHRLELVNEQSWTTKMVVTVASLSEISIVARPAYWRSLCWLSDSDFWSFDESDRELIQSWHERPRKLANRWRHRVDLSAYRALWQASDKPARPATRPAPVVAAAAAPPPPRRLRPPLEDSPIVGLSAAHFVWCLQMQREARRRLPAAAWRRGSMSLPAAGAYPLSARRDGRSYLRIHPSIA